MLRDDNKNAAWGFGVLGSGATRLRMIITAKGRDAQGLCWGSLLGTSGEIWSCRVSGSSV